MAEENPPLKAHEPIHPKDATVLIVEDNVSNFVLMARMLAYMGVPRCEWKTSGWQVVEFADTLPKIDELLRGYEKTVPLFVEALRPIEWRYTNDPSWVMLALLLSPLWST